MQTQRVLSVDRNFMPMSEVDRQHAVKSVASGRAVILDLMTWMGISADHPKFTKMLSKLQIIQFPHARAVTDFKLRTAGGPRAILQRDKHICQYCGKKATTVDHVIPRAQGGPSSWQNLVAACFSCNQLKGNRTPQQAGMPLLGTIRSPRYLLIEKYHELTRKAARMDN